MRTCGLLFFISLLIAATPSRAAEPIDLALVLVTDVSRSIDDHEYDLEKHGTASALLDPQVQAAIHAGAIGSIAVAYVEFAGSNQVRTVIDFTVIHDSGSAQIFADRLEKSPRSAYGRTSISAGIDAALNLLAEADLEPSRRVIDVCGDGTNNSGRDVQDARDEALRQGIQINGLTIINDHPVSYTFAHVAPPGGLTEWYRQNVKSGPGSFVVEVHDFTAFGEAMKRKLLQEIAATPSRKVAG